MSHIKKITPEYFSEVKHTIRWSRPQKAVRVHGISLSTALNIKGCKNYAEYMELVRSEHNPTQFSLREHVLTLHKMVFDKDNPDYKEPRTAQTAIVQLEYELGNK